MDATAPPLDLFTLSPTSMLTTEQVASLGLFGARATLEHNRCVGRPGPRYIKITGRVMYRASDLVAYLAVQEAASERQMAERRARYERRSRRPSNANAEGAAEQPPPVVVVKPEHPTRKLWCQPRGKEGARAGA